MAIGAALAPAARQRAFSAIGVVAPGALWYTWAAGGTVTPQATYSDSALTQLNANPLVADQGGLFGPVYLQFGQSYRFQWKNADGTLIWDQDNVLGDSVGATVTVTLVGAQNNLVVAGGATSLRLNNATLLTITGITPGSDGQLLTITSVGAGQVNFAHADTGSTAAARLVNLATSAPTSLAPGKGEATYQYDGNAARWRLIAHEQGDWITPTFDAVRYSSIGGSGWTVGAADVLRNAYYLRGTQLSVQITLVTTTVGGTPTTLLAELPGAFATAGTGSAVLAFPAIANPSGVAAVVRAEVLGSGGHVYLFPTIAGTGTWGATTNTTNVAVNFTAAVI